MKQKLPVIVAVVAGLVGVAVYFLSFSSGQVSPVVPAAQVVEEAIAPSATPTAVSLSFQAITDGQTALDLLKESAQVEYQEFDFGVMVSSINGVAADDKHYWALYVNDEYAIAGASETILKTGDTMQWKYEEISEAPVQ